MTRTFRLVGIQNEDSGEYHLFLTNLDRENYSAPDRAVRYRARWEIELPFKELKSRFRIEEIETTNAYIIEALIITAAISLLMSRVIIGELRKLELKQRESADDAPPSSTVLTRCGATCTLIQFYLILDLGYDLPDLDELLLWASRDPNPHRPRLREQVESGRFW